MLSALLLAASAVHPSTAGPAAFGGRDDRAPPVARYVGPWTAEEIAEVEAGFAALPTKLLPLPGGVLELELHRDAERPFGMGAWSADGRRLHLYAMPDAVDGERRAQWRLEHLSPEERHGVWRRRAAVHAAFTRWNAYLKLSDRPAWRQLNGWLRPFDRVMTWSERPLNLSDGAYSRSAGKQSAALDLITFAEELFVPVESLPADDLVRCQELSKTRVLWSLLHEHGLVPPAGAAPECPAFDRWANLEHLSHFEVLLVQASGRRPESLFGHVLLRPVHVDASKVRGPSFETAIQLAAVTEQFPGLKHLYTGVVGGYRLSVLTLSLRDIQREMLEREQRSMRRFRLQLSAEQNRRLLERTWELERRGSFDYQFFTDNCGSALFWMVQGALGEDARLEARGALLASPGATVDDLALATLDGKPLLEHIPDDFESSCERARRADLRRLKLEAQLPLDATGLRAPDSGERERAREAFAAYTRAHPCAALYEWWALTVRVEQCAADLASRALSELDLLRVENPEDAKLDVDAELADRERLFERETALQRHLMLLDRAERARELLASLPRRPLTRSQEVDVARDRATVAAYDRLVEQHASLVRGQFAGADPRGFLAADRRALREELVRNDAQSLSASGHWRVRAGAGAWVQGGAAPVVMLSSSGLAEELGDQRIRGFQPGVSLHVLDGEAWLLPRLGWPELAQSKFTLFGLRSLIQSPPWARDGALPDLGFGAELVTDTRRGRALENRSGLQGELLGIAGRSARYTSHLAFGLGLAGFVTWGEAPVGVAGGAYATVVGRLPLPGHGNNGLRVEAKYALLARMHGRSLWLEELEAKLGADVKAGPVLLQPRVVFAVQRDGWAFGVPVLAAVIAFERVSEQ